MSTEFPSSGDVRAGVAEAIGTAALVLIGPGAAMVAASTGAFGHMGVALAFGLVVMIVVAALGSVSGAHINPAVTIALWSAGRFPGRSVPVYIVSQCAGAIAAAFTLRWLLGPVADVGATFPATDLVRSFAIEGGYSGILALVILMVATDDRAPRAIVPIAIGGTVFAGALVTGPLTGGSFNPARSLGPAIAGAAWDAHWLYWVAPITGMLLAARVHAYLVASAEPEGGILKQHLSTGDAE